MWASYMSGVSPFIAPSGILGGHKIDIVSSPESEYDN